MRLAAGGGPDFEKWEGPPLISHVTGTYADVYAWPNLYLAYRKAAAGKRRFPPAAAFEFHLEENLVDLHDALASGTYRPGPYVNFKIREPKERIISAAPFTDRVVHHALVQVIEPAFERSFIEHSYANRAGKGTHRAIDTCQRWMQRHRYVLPCDIRQFFPAIDHQVLQGILNRRIPDAEIRWLVGLILESGSTSPAGDCRPGEYRTGSVPYPDHGAGLAQTQSPIGTAAILRPWADRTGARLELKFRLKAEVGSSRLAQDRIPRPARFSGLQL